MDAPTATPVTQRTNPREKRIALFYKDDLPETRTAVDRIRIVVTTCAQDLDAIFTASGGHVDIGRSIAAIDALQTVKTIAESAVRLPFISDGVWP